MSSIEKKNSIIDKNIDKNEIKVDHDRKPENKKPIQAEIGWDRADYDIRNTREGKSIISHGDDVSCSSTGIGGKYVRAFIFEGMVSGNKGDAIACTIQESCSTFWVWDHARISIRKINRPDGLANYRIEILHADVFKLRQFAKILKTAGFVEKVFEDIPRRENVLA